MVRLLIMVLLALPTGWSSPASSAPAAQPAQHSAQQPPAALELQGSMQPMQLHEAEY